MKNSCRQQKMPTPSEVIAIEQNESFQLVLSADRERLHGWIHIDMTPRKDELEADSEDQEKNINATNDSSLSDEADKNDELVTLVQKEGGLVRALPTPVEVIWLLQKNGIVQSIDYSGVYDFCAQLEMGSVPEPVLVAVGVPPQTGRDGQLELKVKVFGSEVELEEDESGRVDLKDLHTFTDIEPGQKLAVIHSPKQGIPGVSITGQPLEAEPGAPCRVIAGEGVDFKYGDRVAFALKAGRAILDKDKLSVVDSLLINGDVDLSVGDIRFNGLVEIKGDIPDDFDVKAAKGLMVHGAVGACRIESNGDVVIGSMAGRNIGTIICHGALRARFLNQVNVFCYGDVLIVNEIRNSMIKSTGRIIVERGGIIGGRCLAYAGVEAQLVGAPSGVPTVVTAGRYFPDADRFDYLSRRHLQIVQQITSINEAIAPLQRLIQNNPEVSAVAERRLVILLDQLSKLEQEQIDTRAEIAASTRQNPAGGSAKINVHKKIWAGAEFHLGETRETLTQDRRGPTSIIENSREGGLRFLSLSQLSLPADEIEARIFETEAAEAAVAGHSPP